MIVFTKVVFFTAGAPPTEDIEYHYPLQNICRSSSLCFISRKWRLIVLAIWSLRGDLKAACVSAVVLEQPEWNTKISKIFSMKTTLVWLQLFIMKTTGFFFGSFFCVWVTTAVTTSTCAKPVFLEEIYILVNIEGERVQFQILGTFVYNSDKLYEWTR